jgi:hypothetical protein
LLVEAIVAARAASQLDGSLAAVVAAEQTGATAARSASAAEGEVAAATVMAGEASLGAAVGDVASSAEDLSATDYAAQAGELAEATATAVEEEASAEAAGVRAAENGAAALEQKAAVVRSSTTQPWGSCPDPAQADALAAQLLTEAKSVSSLQNYPDLPSNTPVRVLTELNKEQLLLLSERFQTEVSSSVEGNQRGVIFYRSSQLDEAKNFVEPGDLESIHTHPGINEVMPSPEDLRATLGIGQNWQASPTADMIIVSRGVNGTVVDMTYTVAEAQTLYTLLQNGDTVGFLRQIDQRYQAAGLKIDGTALQASMRRYKMIP